MIKYVALIRGIGPGDPQKTNQKLRSALDQLGYSNIQSVISSGNVIFESDEGDTAKLEATIEAGWKKFLGFEATTIVRSKDQLQRLLDKDPFDGAEHKESSYLLASFFKQPLKLNFALPCQPEGKPYTIVGYDDRVLFTITDNSIVKTSDLMTWIEKRYGKEGTSRTPLTIQRIIKRMEA